MQEHNNYSEWNLTQGGTAEKLTSKKCFWDLFNWPSLTALLFLYFAKEDCLYVSTLFPKKPTMGSKILLP